MKSIKLTELTEGNSILDENSVKSKIRIKRGVSSHYLIFRRSVEVFLIILLSPILIPVVLLISLVIAIDSKGGIFFYQTRIGYKGCEFKIIKFRTMVNEIGNDFQGNTEINHKITRIGCFLRKHRLDELPQLWNVLIGNMSLIGPRPEYIKTYNHITEHIPEYADRTKVPQGITGWAQVNYSHTITINGSREKLEYDMYYINNFSIILDLKIVIKTMPTIIFGRGSC